MRNALYYAHIVQSTYRGPPMLQTFTASDPHGRKTNGGTETPKRTRQRIVHRRLNLHHKVRNGAYDTLTYYHVLETVMRVVPGQVFRTRDLVNLLKQEVSRMSWDTATVGRVLSDISEALNEVYGFKVIATHRRFDGMWFDTSSAPAGRAAMERLLEDLAVLAETVLNQEDEGIFAKRLHSPLENCPSLKV